VLNEASRHDHVWGSVSTLHSFLTSSVDQDGWEISSSHALCPVLLTRLGPRTNLYWVTQRKISALPRTEPRLSNSLPVHKYSTAFLKILLAYMRVKYDRGRKIWGFLKTKQDGCYQSVIRNLRITSMMWHGHVWKNVDGLHMIYAPNNWWRTDCM